MGLELVPYEPEHAMALIVNEAREPVLKPSQLTADWALQKKTVGPARTGMLDGKIVACGGLAICWPGMAEGWCVFAAGVRENSVEERALLAREVKILLYKWIEEHELVRVQAPLRADFPASIKFAQFLGFEKESTMPNFHTDHSTGLMYSLIIER